MILNILNRAKDILFNKAGTNLVATNTEDAIKEVYSYATSNISDITSDISDLTNNKADKTQINNPNIFDNGWFSINQRSKATYSSVSKVYTVDRWYIKRLNITVDNNTNVNRHGITISKISGQSDGFISQYVPALTQGATYTISVVLNGKLYTGSFIANKTQVIINFNENIYFEYDYMSEAWSSIDIHTTSETPVSLECVKLEYGSTSTLANDHVPNYADELLRCQGNKADSDDTYTNRSLVATTAGLVFKSTFTTDWTQYTLPFSLVNYNFITIGILNKWSLVAPITVPVSVFMGYTSGDSYLQTAVYENGTYYSLCICYKDDNNVYVKGTGSSRGFRLYGTK